MAIALAAVNALTKRFGDKVRTPVAFSDKVTGRDELSVTVAREVIADACELLKTEPALAFDFLLDISGVDGYDTNPRYQVDYLLYSFKTGGLLRLKVAVPEEDPTVPSVTKIWRGAEWHERECYDMFGIRFTGHPDLRRILMWDGYPFHPMRKDFPLEGKPSNVPEVAFTEAAPLQGGPFVTVPAEHAADREPRIRENALPADVRDKAKKP
ncbi:MAG: NADH-quinone oxidoreductase subunit C [Verrucomicrobia bacterium]|nr:NADH-quinone oxidoreductase subunit C [Verrucomicrobiota bacterium]